MRWLIFQEARKIQGEGIKIKQKIGNKKINKISNNLFQKKLNLDIKKLNLNRNLNKFYINQHKLPNPPIEFGKKLAEFANSATDISDGLLADLNNIILSSKCGAKIYSENIPFTKQTKKLLSLKKIDINYLLTCGEDYQLIFTAKKSNSKKIISLARKNSIKITKIGNIIKKKKLVVLNKNNEELLFANLGFKHF